jgi:hypothetical protein
VRWTDLAQNRDQWRTVQNTGRKEVACSIKCGDLIEWLRDWQLPKYVSIGLSNLVNFNQITTKASWLDDGKCLLHVAVEGEVLGETGLLTVLFYMKKLQIRFVTTCN